MLSMSNKFLYDFSLTFKVSPSLAPCVAIDLSFRFLCLRSKAPRFMSIEGAEQQRI